MPEQTNTQRARPEQSVTQRVAAAGGDDAQVVLAESLDFLQESHLRLCGIVRRQENATKRLEGKVDRVLELLERRNGGKR